MFKKFFTALHEKHDWKTLLFHSSWSLTLTSGMSYVLGLFRDRMLAHTFGLSRDLDIYNAAFVIPEGLVNIFVGTVLSAAFLPIFIKRFDEDARLGYRYMHQIMSWGMALIVFCGGLAFLLLPHLTGTLVPGFSPAEQMEYVNVTRLLLISPILFTVSNVYGRVLMSFREFLWYGLSPVLYNFGIVLGILILSPSLGIRGVVIGTLIGNGLHLLIRLYILRSHKHKMPYGVDFTLSPEVKETLVLTAPKIVQYAMASVMLFSFTSIASKLPEGSVAAYNYANNFRSLPISLIGIAIASALFPSLSHDAGKGLFAKFREDFRRGQARTLVYTTLAAVGLALTAPWVIRLLLGGGRMDEYGIALLSRTLQIFCFSIPLESLMHTYHRAYYSLKNTMIPAAVHTVLMVASIAGSQLLSPTLGVLAIPLSLSAGLAVHILILSLLFPRVLNKAQALS